MLVRSTVMFSGCQIWLEADTAKQANRAAARFNRWFIDHIGEIALFIGDKSAAAGTDKKTGTKRGSGQSVQAHTTVAEGE